MNPLQKHHDAALFLLFLLARDPEGLDYSVLTSCIPSAVVDELVAYLAEENEVYHSPAGIALYSTPEVNEIYDPAEAALTFAWIMNDNCVGVGHV